MATSSSSSSASTGSSSGPEVTNLTMHDLETITNQFSDENIVGKGGFGVVYKGEYNGYLIAVKKLFVINELQDKDFTNEFQQLKKVRHENIIRLIAYCHATRHKPYEFHGQTFHSLVIDRALCFEYMPQGSLAKHISDESCIHGWATTYKIIRGTCEGLHYLHKGRGEGDCIYHLDLKPDNILLEKDMTPKIADFGLSRLFGESKTHQTCSLKKGSLGFMPKEYIRYGTISPKNDVFSLGVIIFHLVAGRIRYGDYCDSRPSCENFTEKVQEYWKKKMGAAVSSYTWEEIDLLGVKTCIELAMRCVEKDRAKRPYAEGIIDELQKLDVQIKKMSKKHSETLSGQAAQLLVLLRGQGDGERGGNQAWDQLRGKLVQVATYVANPRITVDALLDLLKDARNLRLGHPEAEALLRWIMASLEEETVRALDAGMAIPRLRELLLVVADQLDMFPLCDSDPVHMVDANSNFCEENMANFIECPNAPYAVVSIVGSQSSGKSYLLNCLFGTKFPVMNMMRGWSQTTRGIMMSRCIGPSLLVLDFQGFDGRETGKETLFEKHAALFALTISDVMLVNMNMFDIGQEHAGGTILFKTIFKERNKLEAGLTKILVVLRMYDREIPLETLRDHMMTNLEEMWRSVNVTSMRFEDYIEINVVGLPDKNSESFQREVTTLRRLLSKINADDNRSSKVPASSFSASLKMFWGAIRKNKKLNIPSYQEALDVSFCRQTAEVTIQYVYSHEDYKLLKAEESPRCFKEISDTLLKNIITMYDDETELFDPKVRDNERQYMLEKINKVFVEHSWELIKKMQKNTSEQFKDDYAMKLKNCKETDVDLSYDDRIVDSSVKQFMNLCEDLKLFDLGNLHKACAELQNNLKAAQLLVKRSAQEDEVRRANQAWDQLRGKLVQFATYVASPRITVDALLDLLEDASHLCLGHPEADALLRCIMTSLDGLLNLLKGARNPSLGHPEAEALIGRIMASLKEETVRALDAGMAIPRLRELLLVVADQQDMVPLCDSDPVHMVNEYNNFCEKNVADIFKCSAQLSAPNAPYAVVSIVGEQSSGKSYLLNCLFGTKFPVMDPRRGWRQTTRGIMMSRCIGPSLLVLDFEGFDGRERGQDMLFERHAALFALTISDIMLVNMNMHDIGREQAGGTLLFKTIFKERIKLEAGLTKILVVVRRYDEEIPLKIIRDDLMRSLEEIWRSVNVTSLRFEDNIEVYVVVLLDKNSESFQREVTTLRRLISKISTDHNKSSKVPASSFSVSSSMLWDEIRENKLG